MTIDIISPQEFGLEETKAQELTTGLQLPLKERELLIKQFEEVSNLEITKETIPQFRELRLAIQKNRTQGINRWHTSAKAYFLAGGKFVDAIKNKENEVNEQMEEVLMNGEKHFENLEKEKIQKLQDERSLELQKYYPEGSHLPLTLGEMDEDTWKNYLTGARVNYETRIAEEKKAEEERIENERLDKLANDRRIEIAPYEQFYNGNDNLREISDKDYSNLLKSLKDAKAKYEKEQEQIRLENERLKKEAQVKEAQLEKERQKLAKEKAEAEAERKRLADIQAKKDAEAKAERDRLQAELDAKNKAEQDAKLKAKQEDIEAKKQAEKASKLPKKIKLTNWVNDFSIDTPEELIFDETVVDILNKFESFKKWAKNEINKI